MSNGPATGLIEWVIERFSRSEHDRSGFSCGKHELDDFLLRRVSQNEKAGFGRTFVAIPRDERVIKGYYTLAASAVVFEAIPEEVSKRLPRHPVPVALLARLAVDQTARGQGLGKLLLMDALKRCSGIAEQQGIYAAAVDALDEEAREFYLHFGFTPLVDDRLHLFLSMKSIRKLFPE